MDNRYLDEAWNNSPYHKVYGFRLKPFCLYYVHMLHSVDSPIILPGAQFGPVQLFMAAAICSSKWSYEGYTLDRLLQPNFLRKMQLRLRLLSCSFSAEAKKWQTYYEDYLSLAKQWKETGETVDEWGHVTKNKTTSSRKDLEKTLATATYVIKCSGWSEETVMMMPIGRVTAWSEYFAISEGAKDTYITEEEEQMMEQDRQQRKAAAEKEASHAKP